MKIKYCVSVASIMAVIEDIEFSIGIQQVEGHVIVGCKRKETI